MSIILGIQTHVKGMDEKELTELKTGSNVSDLQFFTFWKVPSTNDFYMIQRHCLIVL
jgi:hypothetical protein